MERTERFALRMRPDLRAAAELVAEQRRLTLSELMRRALEREVAATLENPIGAPRVSASGSWPAGAAGVAGGRCLASPAVRPATLRSDGMPAYEPGGG